MTAHGGGAEDIFGDGMDMHIFSDRTFCEKQAALPYNNGYGYSSLLAALLRQRAVALLISSETATAERYIKESQVIYTRCMTHGGPPAPGWAQYDASVCRGNLTTGFYTKGLYTFVGPDFYARLAGNPQIDGFASNNLCLQGPSGTTCHTGASAVDVPPGDTHTTTGNAPPGDNATAIVAENLPYPQRLKCGDATRMSVIVNGTSVQTQGQIDDGGQWSGFGAPATLTSRKPLSVPVVCAKLEKVFGPFQACGDYGLMP